MNASRIGMILLCLFLLPAQAFAACSKNQPGWLWNYNGEMGGKYRIRMTLVFGPGEITGVYFYASQLKDIALRGRMLLAVKGDFIASEGNDSDFRGVLYVSGNAQIEGPFRFEGTMIVAGSVKIGGSDEEVRIRARPDVVSQLQNSLSQYRAGRDQRPAGGGDRMQENKKKD